MDGSENISFTWMGYNLMATRENEEDESPVFRGLFLPGGNSGHVMMPLKMDPEQVQIPKKWALGPAEDIQERRRTVIGRTVTTMDSEGNVILTMGEDPGQSTRSSYSGRRAPMPFVPRHSVSGTTSTVRESPLPDRLGMLSAGTKLYLSTSRLQRERKSYQSYWRRKDWLSALSDEERRNLRKQWLKAVAEHGETMSLLDFAYGNLPPFLVNGAASSHRAGCEVDNSKPKAIRARTVVLSTVGTTSPRWRREVLCCPYGDSRF